MRTQGASSRKVSSARIAQFSDYLLGNHKLILKRHEVATKNGKWNVTVGPNNGPFVLQLLGAMRHWQGFAGLLPALPLC